MNLLHRLKEEAIRIKTIMPRYLQLETSRDCNLKCLGCYRRDTASLASFKGERNLTLEFVKGILKMIPTVRLVTFLGDGEPLMNPELGDILRYLASKNIKSWITTNGNLITQEIVNEWERNGKIAEVHISLDAAYKKEYEILRPGGSFEKVTDAIKMVGKSKLPLFINFLVYQEGLKGLTDIVKLAKEANCKGINILHPIFMLTSDLKGSVTRPQDNEENNTYLQEAITLAKKSGIFLIGGTSALSPFIRHCNFPFGLPYITLEGDVYGCCYTPGGGRTEWYYGIPQKLESSDYLMGNIYSSPFKDIWLGEAYKELRDFIKATERPRGTRITIDELHYIRAAKAEHRFSHCARCLWRWGSAC